MTRIKVTENQGESCNDMICSRYSIHLPLDLPPLPHDAHAIVEIAQPDDVVVVEHSADLMLVRLTKCSALV